MALFLLLKQRQDRRSNEKEKYRMPSTLRCLAFLIVCVMPAIPADNNAPNTARSGVVELGHGARAILWRDPLDIASLDLRYGVGGKDHQPRGTFTFLQEDMEGTNPKLDVRDQDGVKWKVKMGAEARPEVVASRLVWAAGYFTTEDYFVEELHIQGLPSHLHRGQDQVGPGGTIHNVRLKRAFKGQEKVGTWQWASNPFVSTREFNGLRVLMALVNNWDLKDSNNAIYQPKRDNGSGELEQIYMVSDLGASFGTSGFTLSLDASRGNLSEYKRSKFISSHSGDYVDFAAPGRPTLIESFNLPVFVHRVDLRWIGKHIPRSDAKWMGQVLAQLSPDQLRDAFRAGGYSPQDANEFAAVVQSRIAELNAL
jgi:hypothetical protein